MEAMDQTKPLTVAPRRSKLAEWLNLRYLDRVMLGASIGLIAFSVFTLASASPDEVPGQPFDFALRQGLYGIAGVALMIAISRLDYLRLRELRVGIYAAMIALIVLVFLLGTAVRGSQRWIELPFFRLQPSELAKTLLCVSLAAVVFERVRRSSFDRRQTLQILGLGLAPAALVFMQPDLGTGIVLVLITVALLFFAGIPWQHFAAIAAAGSVLGLGIFTVAPAVGINVLRDYQQDRLTAFLHPSDDPSDSSYQVNQAVIAVGSGEVTGRGDQATQTELEFLPERHTDFVFATIGERFGFVGAGLVVSLYALLLWRGLRVLTRSKSFYGTLIAGGIVTMLAFQVVVNIGMNLGIMPVTGITLPLISYGGSSVLGTFLALGLLQSIHADARSSPRVRRFARRRGGPAVAEPVRAPLFQSR
jgi:rod shape determining protein RodA